MPRRIIIVAAWLTICGVGLFLRLHNLEDRPMHADEATGARILAERLEGADYSFNPSHFHGPTLSLSTVPLAKLRNESSWPDLSKLTLRLGTVFAGTLIILTPLLWQVRLGHVGALATGAFLASSPLLVYYSRVYIHESWFALFTMLALAALYRLSQRPNIKIALLAGACIGLMYATKETFVITILSWGAGLLVVCLWHRKLPPVRLYLFPAFIVAAAAAFIAALFYSDGFRSSQGIVDAVRTYFVYETTEGHEKPFFFYLHQMLWPKHALGIWWTEASIALFAIIAALRNRHSSTVIFLAAATVTHLLIYSMIGYKTPWLMLAPWAHACLLTGFAFASKENKQVPAPIYVLLVACLGFQVYQSSQASGRFENDVRNPYAYVPTSQDVESLSIWLKKLPIERDAPLAVVGTGYWPLPWYLRSFENIGYWPTVTPELKERDILLVTPEQQPAMAALLKGSHTQVPRSLRENFPIHVYLDNELWQQWMDTED
ncbi:MAG: flippase activity-associated protein Agl23 [Opitutaceae bacterium]